MAVKHVKSTPRPAGRLSASLEDYLEAIYHVSREHGVARAGQIAKSLNVNKSSVTGALKHLAEDGYIDYDPYQYIVLNRRGEELAKDIVWRHEVLKRFLTETLGVDDETAGRSACKMEHYIDRDVVDRLLRFVQFANSCQANGKSCHELFAAFCDQNQPRELCQRCSELAALRAK